MTNVTQYWEGLSSFAKTLMSMIALGSMLLGGLLAFGDGRYATEIYVEEKLRSVTETIAEIRAMNAQTRRDSLLVTIQIAESTILQLQGRILELERQAGGSNQIHTLDSDRRSLYLTLHSALAKEKARKEDAERRLRELP